MRQPYCNIARVLSIINTGLHNKTIPQYQSTDLFFFLQFVWTRTPSPPSKQFLSLCHALSFRPPVPLCWQTPRQCHRLPCPGVMSTCTYDGNKKSTLAVWMGGRDGGYFWVLFSLAAYFCRLISGRVRFRKQKFLLCVVGKCVEVSVLIQQSIRKWVNYQTSAATWH